MKVDENFDKWFRRIAFAILIILILSIPVFTVMRKISYDKYIQLVAEYGSDSEQVKNYDTVEIAGSIYKLNCALCVVSILVQIVYFSTKKINSSKKGATLKEKLARNWPILLLAFFMAWTSVGCIQAGMEADAERYIRTAEKGAEIPDRIVEIANWTSGDRMQNAADRSWNGCNNLKDGYFSFLFYGTILLNVIMLGNNAENFKRWIMRSLLITSLIMVFCTYMSFFAPDIFAGTVFSNRMIFNNSNHFGYYMTVVIIMSVCMVMTEKNLYFKGLALINCLFYFPMLLLNRTFGTYLGVLFAMIFLFIVALIRLISRKQKLQFIMYMICAIYFVFCMMVVVNWNSANYSRNYNYFYYSYLDLNFGGNTYRYTFNTISEEEAEKLGITKTTINGSQVIWGNHVEKLDKRSDTIVERNFKGFFSDAGKMLGFISTQAPSGESGSGEKAKSSGETQKVEETQKKVTMTDLNNKLQEISSKYPPVSGESLEEYSERQNKIQADLYEYLETNNLLDASGNITGLAQDEEETKDVSQEENKSGLSDEISGLGSGRGETWIRSLDLMNQRPWFGWGLENMLNEFYQQYGINEGRTHNLVLQLGGTTGIPGVLMYLVATISIWLKVMYDVKLRKYDKKKGIIIGIAFLVATIAINIIVSRFTDKLLINGLATVFLWAIVYACIFFKNVRLRVKDWNEFELVSSAVFVSYMISSLFGNSAFYTSPYFMIFMGMLTYEMLNKTPRFVTEAAAVKQTIAEKKETKAVEEPITEKKETTKQPVKETNKNNKKKKK